MNIKVLVATHKKYCMPAERIYLPIQVGKAGKESLGYQGDDIGDNISWKNPSYCELTGAYWGWKNLQCDYVGLCHYRRYFLKKYSRGGGSCLSAFCGKDLILWMRRILPIY